MRRVSIVSVLLLTLTVPLLADSPLQMTIGAQIQEPVQAMMTSPCDPAGDQATRPAWLLDVPDIGGNQTSAVQPQPKIWCPEPHCGGDEDCEFLCYNGGSCVRSGVCRFCACNP